MAIKIGSNFTFQGEQPNFERDRFATKADMKAFPETSIDDGHLSYCMEDKNTYQFKSSNSVDATTGKWRLFKADVDLSAYATINAMNNALSNKVAINGKGVYSESNVKIATIDIPSQRYVTCTLSIDIRCRKGNILRVNISINTDLGYDKPIIHSSKSTIGNYSNIEKVYYYIDKSNEASLKVIIFYDNDNFDYITGKITGVSRVSSYFLNMEVVTDIPEDAVEIMDIGYGNKNLFYATPKDAAGNPNFRAIDITDIPDLSSKYGTKAEITTINNSITDIRTSLESTQTDFIDLRNKVNAMPKTVFITQAAYDALTTKDANTIYYING